MKNTPHSFHIPVMGTSFTIDTPLKVAKYGITSAISIIDDDLVEKMRGHYCKLYNRSYEFITEKTLDHRAERIRKYLNLMNGLVEDKFLELKYAEFGENGEIDKYFEMLPDDSGLKQKYLEMMRTRSNADRYVMQEQLRRKIVKGAVDVNIMTKLDKINYDGKKQPLPVEYNDALAALRGFAKSELESTVVLSAGVNPSLYAYMSNFEDFYPDSSGTFKKRIALKVSDYRSALIQGMYLAKRGLWVSEYRIESGLNCGGHAFATEGYLLGPILEEFKVKRNELIQKTFAICKAALEKKDMTCPEQPFSLDIIAQGGVGDVSEHNLLLDHYEVDGVGWGTPFLLVPEATNVDIDTMNILTKATEKDLYLSEKSPLGVPMNSVRGNSKDLERQRLISKNRPGSSCPKKYLALNREFTEKSICTASRQYQDLKIKELNSKGLKGKEYTTALESIEAKECLCAGLAASALVLNNINTKSDGSAVSVCPGPNLAYFSRVVSLREMVKHIYGKTNIIASDSRPHVFIKEAMLYVTYLKDELLKATGTQEVKKLRYFKSFKENLLHGINYYQQLFAETNAISQSIQQAFKRELNRLESEIISLNTPEPLAI